MAEKKQSLVVRTGERYGVDPAKLIPTIKTTIFGKDGDRVSDEQMMALLSMAEKYDLDPFAGEITAFPSSKGIVRVVPYDGWLRIMNRDKNFDGIEHRWSDEIIEMPGAKPCPAWCESVIYRKDRQRPSVKRVYLEEYFRPENPQWCYKTKHMLEVKATNQGTRKAFGITGVYDPDEAENIVAAQNAEFIEVAQLEDAEGKFRAFIEDAGLSDVNNDALAKYLQETSEKSGLSEEELIKNYVIAWTADKNEVGKFVAFFRAWQEINVPIIKETPPSNGKKKLISEIDQMIEALKDPGQAEVVVKKYRLELGNLLAANLDELEAIKKELNMLIDKQVSMF